MVSEKLMVYAYAQDRDIGKFKPGEEATVYLRGSLEARPVRITADIASGRVVTVKIRHSERLGEQLWKLILSALRKEF